MFQYNSVAPGRTAFRFACDRRPACEANGVSAYGGRVVDGAFIPSQNLRAGPPRDALLSRCFLVTSLHQQRSNPLGLRPSGSSALVAGEGDRLLRFDAYQVSASEGRIRVPRVSNRCSGTRLRQQGGVEADLKPIESPMHMRPAGAPGHARRTDHLAARDAL